MVLCILCGLWTCGFDFVGDLCFVIWGCFGCCRLFCNLCIYISLAILLHLWRFGVVVTFDIAARLWCA